MKFVPTKTHLQENFRHKFHELTRIEFAEIRAIRVKKFLCFLRSFAANLFA